MTERFAFTTRRSRAGGRGRAAFAFAAVLAAAGQLDGQCLSREYVRLGGRVIAIENPGPTVTTAALPGGTVGVVYSQAVSATGGSGGYTWAATGSLPAGLSLVPATGTISGTPTTAGTASFTLTVTDNCGRSATKPLSITIAPAALTIATAATLPDGIVSQGYSQALSAGGGTAPYSWTLATGSTLPAGFTVGTAGVLSGNPTAAGTTSFTIRVTDSSTPAVFVEKAFSLTIHSSLTITTASLSDATVGQSYTQTLSGGGGGPKTWSFSGASPGWLTLNPATGELSGTPTSAGTVNITVRLAVSGHPEVYVEKTLSLTIHSDINIVTPSLPSGTVGFPYSHALAASGGSGGYVWSTAGGLPAGLTLSMAGTIAGTPTAAGTASFTVTVTDNNGGGSFSKAFTLAVFAPLTITTSSPLPSGVAGVGYTATLTASGGAGPFSWTLDGGSLPLGLSLATNCTGNTCTITGAPAGGGSFAFGIRVADSGTPPRAFSKEFAITIQATLSFTANPFNLQQGQTSTVTATQVSTWSLSGPGSLSTTGPSTSTVYTAPAQVFGPLFPVITATAGGTSYTLSLVVMPPNATLTPHSGTFHSGVATGFTATGTSPDNWQSPAPFGINYEYVNFFFSSGQYAGWGTSCEIVYVPRTQTVYLFDAAGLSSRSLQSTEILSSNHCTLGPGGSDTRNGTHLAFGIPVSFTSAFAGVKNTFAGYSNGEAPGGGSSLLQTGSITVVSQTGTMSLSPTTASVSPMGSRQFTATVTNLPSAAATWSVSPPVGTVSSGGYYTAPAAVNVVNAASQAVTVNAVSQWNPAVTASAGVSILPTNIQLTAPSGVSLFRATNSITAEGTYAVSGAASVTLAAGSEIRLKPGFQATAGSAGTTFRAAIDGSIQ